MDILFWINVFFCFLISLTIWSIISNRWYLFRDFFHRNYSYFDFSFIMAYFLEQVVLILLLKFKPIQIDLWIGLFGLLVVTTASIQKMSMDSKDRRRGKLYYSIKEKYQNIFNKNEILIRNNKELEKQNKLLIELLEERSV